MTPEQEKAIRDQLAKIDTIREEGMSRRIARPVGSPEEKHEDILQNAEWMSRMVDSHMTLERLVRAAFTTN